MSSSTTPGGNRNFGSQSSKAKAQSKQDNVAQNLKDNEQRSEEAKSKPKDQKKINERINAGKTFISKFFQGWSSTERANVRSDLDDTLPFRLSEVYQDSIQAYCEEQDWEHANEKSRQMYNHYVGAISLGMAIKLQKSAPEAEKKSNFSLNCINGKENIRLPKKLSVLIDQLGKTDLPNDNHFRLNNQNMAAKRHLVRGLLLLLKQDVVEDYLANSEKFSYKELTEFAFTDEKFRNMVDNSAWSVQRIKQIGKDIFEKETKENVKFWPLDKDEDAAYTFRLPSFDFKEDLNIDDVGNYCSNKIFTAFHFSKADMQRICAGLILSVCKISWIRNPTSTMAELDKKFQGSFMADVKFKEILQYAKIWNINYYLTDPDLNELGNLALYKWQNGYSQKYRFLDLTEFNFSEFGTDAQLVQVDDSKIKKDKKDSFFEMITFKIKGKAESRTPLKMGENNAMLGAICRYTRNIRFTSDFELNHDKDNRAVLAEFIKNDVITKVG